MTRALLVSGSLLLAAACATTGPAAKKAPAVVYQADERMPSLTVFPAGKQRIAYNDALMKEHAGWRAEQDGKAEQAKPPLEAAARAYVAFLQEFPGTGWDLAFRFHAADLMRRAGREDEAATLAEQVANDPRANAKTRAMAWLQVANALTEAGKLAPLQIEPPGEGEARGAVEPPAPWKRYVDATDAYLRALGPAGEPPERILGPGLLGLVAARVAYATGHLQEARERLGTILERWSNEPQAFEGAAPLYVQTFVAAHDWEGAAGAIRRVDEIASAQAQRTSDADARATYQKTAAGNDRLAATIRYRQAKALLEEGKAAEAAKEFEAIADQGAGDVPAALVGAAVAWDKAGNPERAIQLRQRLLDSHGDSPLAPGAALQLAAAYSKRGDHVASARTYGMHAERWPDDPNHCIALRNGAVELDLAKKPGDAAQRYLAFGKDARCARSSPDVAALALHRAGLLFLEAKRRSDAREAFQAAAAVEGVTSAEARQRVAEAEREAKRLGGRAQR